MPSRGKRRGTEYIESHFAADLNPDDIAGVAGVGRFHLSHAFGLATGQSVARYLRGRRLSEAAKKLARAH